MTTSERIMPAIDPVPAHTELQRRIQDALEENCTTRIENRQNGPAEVLLWGDSL